MKKAGYALKILFRSRLRINCLMHSLHCRWNSSTFSGCWCAYSQCKEDVFKCSTHLHQICKSHHKLWWNVGRNGTLQIQSYYWRTGREWIRFNHKFDPKTFCQTRVHVHRDTSCVFAKLDPIPWEAERAFGFHAQQWHADDLQQKQMSSLVDNRAYLHAWK